LLYQNSAIRHSAIVFRNFNSTNYFPHSAIHTSTNGLQSSRHRVNSSRGQLDTRSTRHGQPVTWLVFCESRLVTTVIVT